MDPKSDPKPLPKPLVERLQDASVFTLGDIMLDRYVSGTVDRISPEAPIPVLHISREKVMLGGVGNVAANIAALNGRGHLAATIGEDGAGEEVRRLSNALSSIEAGLVAQAPRPTTIKTRFVAGTQQMMRADVEDARDVEGDVGEQLLGILNGNIKNHGALVLSDYGKGVLSLDVVSAAIKAANKAGVPVVVDPKGADYSRYLGADVITPNKKELAEASNMTTETDAEVVKAARHIMDKTSIKCVLATRSADGMSVIDASGDVVHMKAQALDVFDVSGAGDTVVAVLALGLAAGGSVVEAAQIANVAAGIVVAKTGTATVSLSELSHSLHHRDLDQAEAKALGADDAQSRIEQWRERGLKIGFTNGCFDLLHPGHISLLSEARGQCDRLVVGLNSDASVARLKGSDRPIQVEAARTAVLGALSDVDAIVVFSDDTPLNLIEALRPDVLIKGADYAKKDVVGGDVVEAYGGRVHLAKIEAGHSTTGTVARLKDK